MINFDMYKGIVDLTYDDFIQTQIRNNSGVIEANFQITIIKFFHLLLRLIIEYLRENENK